MHVSNVIPMTCFCCCLVHRFETILSPQGTNRRNQRYYLMYNSEDCAVLSLKEVSYASFTFSARITGALYFWYFWLLGSSLYWNKTSWWKTLQYDWLINFLCIGSLLESRFLQQKLAKWSDFLSRDFLLHTTLESLRSSWKKYF